MTTMRMDPWLKLTVVATIPGLLFAWSMTNSLMPLWQIVVMVATLEILRRRMKYTVTPIRHIIAIFMTTVFALGWWHLSKHL